MFSNSNTNMKEIFEDKSYANWELITIIFCDNAKQL